MTIVELVVEPGRVAEVPVRTNLVGTSIMEAMFHTILERHDATRDALGDFT